MTKFDKIQSLHNFFLKNFKPRKKVILKFRDMVSNGSYSYNNKKHYITLNKKDNYITLIDNLCHEWGHLLDFNKWGSEHHTNFWGTRYAICYRAYLEWEKL